MSMMSVVVGCACAGVIVALALVVSLHRKLDDRLRNLPDIVVGRLKRERDQDAVKVVDASRLVELAGGIREFHAQLAASLRTEHSDAEMRANLALRESADTATALDAAIVLVREARSLVERLAPDPAQVAAGLIPKPSDRPRPHLPPKRIAPRGILPPPPVAPQDEERTTQDELTHVIDRPALDKTLASMPAVEAPITKRGGS